MSSQKRLPQNLSGFALSVLLHLGILLILGTIYLPQPLMELAKQLITQPGLNESLADLDLFDDPDNSAMIQSFSNESEQSIGIENFSVDYPRSVELPDSAESFVFEPFSDLQTTSDLYTTTETETGNYRDSLEGRLATARFQSLRFSNKAGNATGPNAYAGRGEGMKGHLVAQGGGSEGSERAVALGLAWLAQHQNADGSWSYNFAESPQCRGKCTDIGKDHSLNSATAFALLPFLGAGITPKQGKKEYRNVVEKGLKFLVNNGRPTPQGLSYMDVADLGKFGGMYHQGITALALCEAAALTNDSAVKKAAQGAIDFICWAQTFDGGWRYFPQDPEGGDTSVAGWQILALQSAKIGSLRVPEEVFQRYRHFLDTSVAIDGGAQYAYRSKTPVSQERDDVSQKPPDIRETKATTAIGLLSQMYMGWTADNATLTRGVQFLSDLGPDQGNLYYNYYATQVMHHLGGLAWHNWNRQLRDSLIERQELRGHKQGSWYFEGKWNTVGGRLYTTSLTLLILETYYRYLPLYQTLQEEIDFPLD